MITREEIGCEFIIIELYYELQIKNLITDYCPQQQIDKLAKFIAIKINSRAITKRRTKQEYGKRKYSN